MTSRLTLLSIVSLGLLLSALALLAENGNPHGASAANCAECHTATSWAPLKKPLSFRHEKTGFKLEGSHSRVDCRGCHQSLVFTRVGSTCLDCHKDVHRGELGVRCESCHGTQTWTNQNEIFKVHAKTRFPLLAFHASLDCEACHKNQQPLEYKGTPLSLIHI